MIAEQTKEYRVEQDITGMWLNECTEISPFHETSMTDLYASYRSWAESNGLKPSSNVVLGRRLSDRGLSVRQSNGVRYWKEVMLKPSSHGGFSGYN